jgi:DNA-directed RNA polymerase subunit RPC12/RpoP
MMSNKVQIYLKDLTEEKQKEVLDLWGRDWNTGAIPIMTLHPSTVMEDMDQTPTEYTCLACHKSYPYEKLIEDPGCGMHYCPNCGYDEFE